MILAVGFRVRSKRGTQFRQWANRNLKNYIVKGFVMDERRKQFDAQIADEQDLEDLKQLEQRIKKGK